MDLYAHLNCPISDRRNVVEFVRDSLVVGIYQVFC